MSSILKVFRQCPHVLLVRVIHVISSVKLKLKLNDLGVGLPSGAHDQIFVFNLTIAGFLLWGALSDERMRL
jgi:hypothetical protein